MDLHFVTQKERSNIDQYFTKRGISLADTYIVHAYSTFRELQELFPKRKFKITETGERNRNQNLNYETPVIKLFHTIYDLFEPDPSFDVEAFKKANGLKENVFLFFGFIRKYKGLHNAIEAFNIVAKQRDDVSFMVCGELFWSTLDSGSIITKIKKVLFGAAKRIFLSSNENEDDYNPLLLVD